MGKCIRPVYLKFKLNTLINLYRVIYLFPFNTNDWLAKDVDLSWFLNALKCKYFYILEMSAFNSKIKLILCVEINLTSHSFQQVFFFIEFKWSLYRHSNRSIILKQCQIIRHHFMFKGYKIVMKNILVIKEIHFWLSKTTLVFFCFKAYLNYHWGVTLYTFWKQILFTW